MTEHADTNEPTYCECDSLVCEREHEPYPPEVQAAVDLKHKVQRLSRMNVEGLAEPIQREVQRQAWGVLHEVMRDGMAAGELRAVERIAAWLDGAAAHEYNAPSQGEQPWYAELYDLARAIRRGDWHTVPRSET